MAGRLASTYFLSLSSFFFFCLLRVASNVFHSPSNAFTSAFLKEAAATNLTLVSKLIKPFNYCYRADGMTSTVRMGLWPLYLLRQCAEQSKLDLHVLYVKANRRGGYEKVVSEKKWREVGSIFMFSPTTTSASFVLRKHYLGLLYHYEQVHFFRLQGRLCTSNATFPLGSSPTGPELAIVEYSSNPIRNCTDLPIKDEASCGSPAWIGKGLTCVCFKRKGTCERVFINLTPLQQVDTILRGYLSKMH